MKQRDKILALQLLIIVVLVYLFGAFIASEINPIEWNWIGKIMAVLFTIAGWVVMLTNRT